MITLSDVINRESSFDFDRFSKDIANLSKGECEELLGNIQSEILKGGDSDVLHSCRSLVLDRIEKARSGVYADTAENRKLGRVGQQYGGKKSEDDSKGGKKKKDNSITDKTLHNTLRELALTGTLRNLKGVSPKRRGEIMDELEKRGYLEPNSINVTKKGTAWLSGLL